MDLLLNHLLEAAIGVVITALLTYAGVYLRKRFRQLDLRDAVLAEVRTTLIAVREDNQCQYSALLAIFEAQELQLHALKGKKMNGNVDEALEKVSAAKAEIQARLLQQACK